MNIVARRRPAIQGQHARLRADIARDRALFRPGQSLAVAPIIKPGKYIFIIAPHKDRTFDKPASHAGGGAARQVHGQDQDLRLSAADRHPGAGQSGKAKFGPDYGPPQMLISRGARLAEGVQYEEDDHHHWSVWRTHDFVDLVQTLRLNIVEVQDTDDKVGNGFSVVIRK